jgi:hypothetical protein
MSNLHRLFVCVGLISSTFAKVQSGSITLGGDQDEFKWKYISKFGYNIGTGTWAVRFKTLRPSLNKEVSITTDVFLDLEWDQVESEENVCARHKYRRASGTSKIPANGEWSEWIQGSLSQAARPYIWYIAANDCGNELGSPTRLRFEFVARQEDGDEFSVEMIGSFYIVLIELAFFSFLCYNIHKECRKIIKSADGLHPVMYTLLAMVGLHFGSVLCQFFHLRAYSHDGVGFKALDVIAEILNVLSQVIGTSLLILIALGYTLLHSKLGNLDVVIPVVFIIAVLHVLLVGFGKIKDDASYKFYENEGVVGWVLLVLRGLLLVWFVWAVKETAKEASNNSRMIDFLQKFLIAGIVYFLSYPLVFVITGLFVPYFRYKVMTIGSFLMRFGSYLWMTKLFLSRGDYFQVSTLKNSFLPGGLIPGITKEE